MKNFTKFLAVVLVIIIALSTAACSLTPQTSYKEGDNELAIGVYIYAMYNAYTQAQSFAQQTEGYDAEAGTYDGDTSFLKVEITDEEGKKATADQWIMDETDRAMRTLLAVDKEFDRLGATIDQASMEGYQASAKEYWDYGPYYSMYGEQYINPYKDIFEPLGVSYDSFEYFYITSAKQEVIFDMLYNEGGEKAVSNEELAKFFEDNYTSYVYFSKNLYETEQQTGEDGSALSSNVAFSKKRIANIENKFEGYVNDTNSGKDVDDVVKAFMKDSDLETDPSVKNVEIMADSTIGEDLVAAINDLKDNKASYKIIGEADTQVIYYFFKEAITKQTENYINDEANRESVLQSYKGDEFKSYIDDIAKSLDVTISKAVKKYSPEMFED
ncbi:MAG: hypothetical protein IJD68_08065 [Ruminococcus sp.]|nr:hypothetical protein [Ruminococcus sp.]